MPYSSDFITYSEGANDDVNKFVWSGLGWDPKVGRRADPAALQPLLHRRSLHRSVRAGTARAGATTGAGRSPSNACVYTTLRAVPGHGARGDAARPEQLAVPAGAVSRVLRRVQSRAVCSTRRRSKSARSSGCATPPRPADSRHALAMDAADDPRQGRARSRPPNGGCASTCWRKRCSRASGMQLERRAV